MSLIKPSRIESLYITLDSLESDRLRYYDSLFRVARSLFLLMGETEKAKELMDLINKQVEIPLNANFQNIMEIYNNIKFQYSVKAYLKIGEGIDATEVSKQELKLTLQSIADWIYDELDMLSSNVRFTKYSERMA